MKLQFRRQSSLILIWFIFFLCSCQNRGHDSNEVTITFNVEEGCMDTVRIYQSNSIDGSRINNREFILDSLGRGYSNFHLEKFEFYKIQIGEHYLPISILLDKDSDIFIQGRKTNLLESLQIKGIGSKYNNLRLEINNINRVFNSSNGKHFSQLDSTDFHNHLKLLNNSISNAIDSFPFHSIKNNLKELLIDESQLMPKMMHLNYYLVNRGLKAPSIEIPWNAELLKAYSPEYQALLAFYQDLEIINPLWKESGANFSDSIKYYFPQLVYEQIMALETNTEIKEFLIARYIFYYHLSTYENTPVAEDTFSKFLKLNPNSKYLGILEKRIEQNQEFEDGMVAPEIKGVTPTGDSLYLSNFKGKIVYIDVWATWCGPCIKEFPAARRLQNEFGKDNRVVFLYVSVDKDSNKWQQYLKDNQLSGIHINSGDGNFLRDYRLSGIPQYILVDKDGRISNIKAPEPSSVVLRDEIYNLM